MSDIAPGRLHALCRTGLERLARGRSLKRSLLVGDQRVPIFVSPDAQLKYLKRRFDEDLIRLATTRVTKGDNVWDIGANVGVFGFVAAEVSGTGTIVLVEPDPWLAQLLHRTRLQRHWSGKGIHILCSAIGSKVGAASFSIAGRGRAANHLTDVTPSSQTGGTRNLLTVPILTLDVLAEELGVPHFIKIDVEGAELGVLNGAHSLLANHHPTIFV